MGENQDEVIFPYFSIITICIGMIAHSVVFTAPLPYVAFMIVDFHMSDSLDQAGYTAGWITGMFMIGRCIAGIPWGLAADRWGRKICLFLSMFNVMVLGIMFGFSTNFYMALTARFLLGMGNGFMGIAKSYTSEIVKSRDHEVRAFGYINAAWGLGIIVGPMVGGMLARPAVQYPSVFHKDSLWGHYPYLLPSLICACLAGVTAVGILLFVPETLNQSSFNHQYHPVKENEDVQEDLENRNQIEVTDIRKENVDVTESYQDEKGLEYQGNNTLQSDKDTQERAKELPTTLNEILSDSHIRNLFIIYMSFCGISIFFDESFPLYAVTSLSNGGLAWESLEVGETLALVGFGCVIFQFFCFDEWMKRYFNKGNNDNFVRLLTIISCIMPLLPILADGTLRLVIALDPNANSKTSIPLRLAIIMVLFAYRIPSLAAYTCISMMVNASVDTSMRGTVNGLMMTAGSIGNALGPILGSAIYAEAIRLDYARDSINHKSSILPIDGRIVFILSAVMCFTVARFGRKVLPLDAETQK